MKELYIAFVLFIIVSGAAYGQEYVFVNTENLLLRDRPEKKYRVLAILNSTCKIKLEKYEDGYKNDKAITDKFYQVSLTYKNNEARRSVLYRGWVEKKYTVKNPAVITSHGIDTTLDLAADEALFIPYMGRDGHNPNKMNYAEFPYPKYKGGEKHFENGPKSMHVYHSGPRGGCYYINKNKRKVYVNNRLCK